MQRPYRGSRSHWRQRRALAVAVAACFAGNFALANPTGPAVAQGQASFATQGNTLTVTNAPGTVINWQGFSIAGNEIARFIQQSQSSSVLNRVVGINPSSILGSLQSNGRVFLVNPNGITIGPGANIDVAGFMASTLNLSDADFLAGRMRFTPASGAGSVVNQGTITTAGGGMVYLVGQDVQNSGIIRSPQGEILLAAGKSVELVDAQTPEVRVQLTAPDNQALNLGQLIATGGRIGMYGTLVRNAGVASANTAVMGENGKIVFKAVKDVTLEAGSVTTASGTQAGAGGGGITIEGERIVNAGAVQVNAADQAAAGNIKMLAQRELVLGNTSRIEAKGADRDSSGGRVFLYSHGDATAINGQLIDISGGLNSGNAGSGEFSAANLVSFGGTLLGNAAPGYARGSFLIDPLNFSFTGGTIAANTTVQAEDNITIDGNATINAGITLTLLADHDDNGGSPAAGVWDTGGGGTGTVGVGSITRSGNFTISGGAGSGLIMYAAGGGIGIGGSGAIQTDLNGGSLSVTINPAAVGAANVAVNQTSINALSIAGIAAGSNAVALTAGGTIGQTGAISAGLLTTSSAGGTVLNGANLVGAFTASNTGAGNIELTNTIATLDIQGITQNTGDVIIGNTGAITQSVAGITTAADGNINLTASTALTASQVVTAGGNGAVTLAGSNVVLGANVTGATVNIDATGAITRTGGVVTADTINLGVAGNTTAIGATGAGRIRVASTGGIASPAVDARATTGGVFIEQASGDLATSSYSLNVAGSGQSIELATTNGSIAVDHVAQWNANTADDNVSLLAQGAGSNITAGGSTILTANDATLTATGGTVTLPATSLSGDLSVTAGGAVTDAGDISVTGSTSITAGTANNITLDNDNDFGGTVTIVSANNVTLNDINGLTLAGFSISGDLSLTAGGTIQQGSAFTVTGTSAFDAGGDVALAGAANSFTGTVTATAAGLVALRTDATPLELGNVSVGTGALTLQLGGDVTQAAATAITKTGNGLVSVQSNAAGVNVALGNAGNDFGGGAVSLSGTFNNVSVRDTNAAAAIGALPASIGGDLTLQFDNAGITVPGVTVGGNLSLTATGIQQGGLFTVTGTSAFNSGAGGVALAGFDNSFGGVVTASASGTGVVALRTDATPLVLGNVSTGSAGLGLYLKGDVSQSGGTAITAGGPLYVEANAAVVNVALASATNDFNGGSITLATAGPGTYNNVAVRDTDSLASINALPANIGGNLTLQFDNAGMTVPGMTVGGNLSLTATGIQQGGIFAVTGTSAFNSGAGDVALAGFNNSFGGAVTASATGAGVVALRTDATPLVLGNVSTGSAGLGLYLNGDVSQAGGTAITAGGPLYVEANAAGVNVALSSATNDFNGGSITLATVGPGAYTNVSVRDTDSLASINALPANIGGNLTLQFDNAGMTLPGVTVGGNLSLTAGGSIQQGGAFTVTGTSAFDAGGDVALAGAANSFTGTVTASAAGLVALQTGATALELGNVALTGTGGLTLQLGGDVTQAAATGITKTGNGAVSVGANVAGVNVALGNAGNDFGGGAVSLSGLGTFSNVSVRDTNAAAAIGALPASIGGDLTLQFDNAGITVPGVTVSGNLSLTAGGTVSVSGNVSSTGTAELTTTSGNIALGGDFGSSGAAATLISAGNITRTAGTVSGTDVILDSVSGIGGGTGARVFTAAGNLAARSTGSGSVFLSESDALTLATLTGVANGAAGTAYDLTAGGTITVSAAVNGAPATGGTTLATTLGNIALGANVGNATGSTTLVSAGDITRTAGTVSGADVILDSVSGIGGGTGARVFTAAGNLAARSTGSGGVFVRESDAVTLATLSGVANGAAGGGAYDVASGGNVSVGATVSGGPVNISAAGTIADSAQITGTTLTTSSAGGTVLDFGHAVTGFNATNITGGNIQLVNVASTLTVTGISQNGGGNVLINNTGALTINGAIGNAGTGGTINLTGSTGINLNQNLTATDGNITLNNATTLGANVQIAAGTGDVTLTGATGIGANNLTVSSSNVTTVTGGITGTTGNVDIAAATRTDVDGAIVLSGAGTVQLDRALLSGVNVTTAGGNITFDGAAATDTAPLQVGSGGGDVLFNNTLTLGSGAGLTVLSGAGATTFAGTVTGPAALTVTASGNTVFSSAIGAGMALASLTTDGGGLTQVNGGAVTTTGGQTYSDAVTLGADTTLAGAGITFSNTLNSSVTARTLQINDSGTTTFGSAVGNTLGLATLSTNAGGTTAINGGSLVTTGVQTYGDAVTLGANTVLTGTGITFNGTLDSAAAARTLQINDSGTTTFGGLVGNTLALASLATDTGGITAINTTGITTTGGQTYNDAVTLGALATLTSSGGSNIRFVDALDGSSGLIVNTAGNTIFSAVVGGTTPLASLTTDAAGSTQVNGGAVTTVGAQTYNDGITIAGPTTFNATATTATLDFNATLAAATHALTLTADEINFAGGAGSVTGSGLLTLQPNSTAAALNAGSAAGATVGALDLSATDLAALGNGFSTINLGQPAGTHAITIGNAAFQDPLLVRTPAGGSVSVSGALSSTENIAFNAGGAVQGGGSVTAPRVTFTVGGIGSLAAPLQLNTPDLDVQNSAGDAVMVNAGPVSLLNNFSNTAPGGELRLITSSGAIDTGVVAVQSAGGRIALIANDTAGGATGNIIVGSGGITSAGGDIALHAADNITIDGAIASGAGNVRMLAGTGPGINAAHATFTGSNPPAPTEPATDDFGFITFNAPVSAANMVLVSSTSTTPTVVSTITQTAAGSIATTGALTAVTLRGAGAPGNGGGTIDLNDATGNNSTGLINLFACSFDGCPNALPTAPFVNQGAPLPPFTTAVYSDGQLFYSDVGGTDVTGIGTSGDFTLYTPGSVSITGPSLSAKNLTIEALVDINVNLLAPFTNNDINGGQPGGSLNFIAGQNVNYTSMVSGATIGTAAVPFNHDLRFQAAGNVTVANAIYVGAGNFVVRANEPASLNNNTVNIPASGTGSVFMQGNHVVSSMGDLTVSGINLTVQGGDTGSANQSAVGQQLLSAGAVNLNLLGDVTVNGGTATGGSDSAAIIRGAVVNVGSAATPVANLSMTGGNSTVTGTTNHEADARIEGTTALNVNVSGDVGLAGGTAIITGTAGSSQKAGASAILKSNSLLFSVAGNVTLTGGTANAATGGNTATANAQIIAGSAFNPVILGDLDLVGGSATAQPIAGEIANAVAGARFESEGDLLLKVNGNINLQGGNAVAINNTGGIFAEADASALVRSGAKVGIEVGQNFDITGGSAVATGSGIRAIGSAGVSTGDIAAGESLLIKTAGNMSMTGGSGSGAAADAAALIYSAAEAKLTVGGPTGLRLEGGTGPFFPPFSTGVFTPNSDLFHMIGGNALVRLEGSAYPITVTGSVTVVNTPALGAALFISEAPPLSLDSLLAAFIKTTDCVSFSGGACTLSSAVASGSGKGVKDPVGGVCK